MRVLLITMACAVAISTVESRSATTCTARASHVGQTPVLWQAGPIEDTQLLEQWCQGVGPPLLVPSPATRRAEPPALEDLVVLTWNAHLGEGRLAELVGDLRAGHLTSGRPVHHFVLLLQELYRRGSDVPSFGPNVRTAFAIKARNPDAPDARDYAQTLGLALFYVPSMRNGAQMSEDRGNAIVSSEPLLDALALELPFERQRRVAAGAAVHVRTPDGTRRLPLLDVHLEPLSAPSSLWLFRNPRRRQVAAVLDLLHSSRFANERETVGAVLGGDFNTIQGGVDEDAYRHARAWSSSLAAEDPRSTHYMGRLDYLFARLSSGWTVSTTRVDNQYGSDHYPVIARFQRITRDP